jgi:hypothetical protein
MHRVDLMSVNHNNEHIHAAISPNAAKMRQMFYLNEAFAGRSTFQYSWDIYAARDVTLGII